MGDGKHIPKEEVRKKLASGAYYYHPVAYAAWDQRFAKERLTEIPTAGKGQTYVQGPVSVHEGVKYEFFTAEFKALPDTGFPLGGGKHIPKDEVRKKVGNTYYYHPVVRAAWDQRFAKEKLTEIPITSEGQEYVLGPNQKREQTKHKFFTAAFDALPDTGFPLGGGKHIPKDEVRGKFGTAYYYHPVAYAAWDKAFNNRKSIIEAADAGDGEKNDDTPEGGRQTSPHGGFSNITDLKAKPITQKDLTPGSKDLRRTGRSRTVDED